MVRSNVSLGTRTATPSNKKSIINGTYSRCVDPVVCPKALAFLPTREKNDASAVLSRALLFLDRGRYCCCCRCCCLAFGPTSRRLHDTSRTLPTAYGQPATLTRMYLRLRIFTRMSRSSTKRDACQAQIDKSPLVVPLINYIREQRHTLILSHIIFPGQCTCGQKKEKPSTIYEQLVLHKRPLPTAPL